MNQRFARLLPRWLVALLAFPHEACHFGMARLVGVPARIDGALCHFDSCSPKKKALILLGPFLVGFLFLDSPALLFYWWVGCLTDLMALRHLDRASPHAVPVRQ